VVYYNPAATLLGSNIAFASISFFPGTNTTIDARLLPIPLAVAVGTIASPILYGDITSYSVAQDWDLIDNNASALSFDTTGKAGVLELVTTNSAEGVKMSGFASVVGNVTGGNILTGGLITATGNITGGNILTGGLISATGTLTVGGDTTLAGNLTVNGNITYINSNVITTNEKSITLANNQSTAANVDGSGIDIGNTTIAYWRFNNATTSWQSNISITPAANGTLSIGGASNYWNTAYLTTASVTGNITGGNILTAGLISATSTITSAANITGGNLLTGGLISATGNVTGGNILFGSGIVSGTGNITGGNVLTSGLISATANITGGNLTTANLTSTGSLSITGNTATVTTANYSIGYLNIPQVSLASNTTTALTDSGKHYYSTSASNLALTIANNTSVSWPVGTAISIINRGTGNITIAGGTGVSLYLAGNSTAGNRIVTTYGMATVMNVAANIWMINGTVV